MENKELMDSLQTLPAAIAYQAEIAEQARYRHEQAKALYDNEYYKTYLTTKAKNSTFTQDQVKATAKSACISLWLEVIKAESTWKSQYIKMVELNDKFQGLKVVAKLVIMDWQAQVGGIEK